MLKTVLAIILGKAIFFVSRVFKIGGGSAAPGYYALKIDPEIVSKLSRKIPQNIIITGTNGKTTTSRLIAHFLKDQKTKIIRNSTGSNLERGVASALIREVNLMGGFSAEVGIWEVDEAAFNTILPKINPKAIVFLNVFRDQLDRYGEVDSVLKKWVESLEKFKSEALIMLNGDDENIKKLSKSVTGKVQRFGLKDFKIKGESISRTPEKERFDFEAEDIKTDGLTGTDFRLNAEGEKLQVRLPIPGIYHIYDFLAAFSLGFNLNLDASKMINSLEGFSPAFGRVEKFKVEGKDGYIFLIKNPAGATQVFQTLGPEIKKEDRLLIALNDNFADGKDVSWIWDAEFEFLCHPALDAGSIKIKSLDSRVRGNDIEKHGNEASGLLLRNDKKGESFVVVSGTRADDMAVRLKYTGFEEGQIRVVEKLDKGFEEAKTGLKGRLFILPTYTAMLEIQRVLVNAGIKKNYWEEEG